MAKKKLAEDHVVPVEDVYPIDRQEMTSEEKESQKNELDLKKDIKYHSKFDKFKKGVKLNGNE